MKNEVSLLRLFRLSKGLSLMEAGLLIPMSGSTLSLIERGVIKPKKYKLEKILEAYDINISEWDEYPLQILQEKLCSSAQGNEIEDGKSD